MMKSVLSALIAASISATGTVFTGCTAGHNNQLQSALQEYIDRQDARIGVAVIFDGTDTVEVNGHDTFPMLSVYKFPQALAVADYCRRNAIALSDTIAINASEIKENTWSPLRDTYGVADLRLPVTELLALTLQQSDNNACDILFRLIGGPPVADSLINSLGFPEIVIASTEDEMHRDTSLCFHNSSTPIEMARLLDLFNSSTRYQGEDYEEIARLMETCATGTDRLRPPLETSGIILGHKTGTGDIDADGRIVAVNDCGYVNLPDGRHYSIAVFITGSADDMPTTSAMIAEISRLVLEHQP